MTASGRTRTITPLLGGTVAVLAVVAVIIALMSRSDGDTTDLGATEPTTTTSAPTESADATTAPVAVEYAQEAKDAVAAGLPVLVPDPLPDGWTLTAADYDEETAVWHVMAVTGSGGAVDLWQAAVETSELVSEHAPGTVQGEDLDLSRFQTGVWSTWTADGVVALAQDFGPSSVVVVGATQPDAAQTAKRLLTFEYDSPDVQD